MPSVTSPHTYNGFRDAYYWLDPEIDGDASEDAYDICQHILAHGSIGTHPNAWSNDHDPLTRKPLRWRGDYQQRQAQLAVKAAWEAHWARERARAEPPAEEIVRLHVVIAELPTLSDNRDKPPPANPSEYAEINAYIFKRYGPQ